MLALGVTRERVLRRRAPAITSSTLGVFASVR
jgi:hypothetical protein